MNPGSFNKKVRIFILAVRHLVSTELYKKHSLSFDGDWLNQMGAEEEIPFIADESDREVVEELLRQHSHSQSNDEQVKVIYFSVLLWPPEKAAFQQI